MTDRSENSRIFLTEFIELYKSLPCLWYTKSKQYRDRNVKNKAYSELLRKYQEIDPTATKGTVKCKINALRTTYRKVLSRLNQSLQSGASGEEVYKPTLWYFYMFDFLRECETPVAGRNVHDDDHDDSDEVKREDEEEDGDDTLESGGKYYNSDPFAPATPTSSSPTLEHQYISSTSPRTRASLRKRKRSSTHQDAEQATHYGGEKFGFVQPEDQFDLFGRHIANKLRSLNTLQNVFAQKLINDVVFEAEMESLTRGCKIVTESLP